MPARQTDRTRSRRDNQRPLREHLLRLLEWEDAHAGWQRVLSGFPARYRGRQVPGVPYTAWQLLAHLHIAQNDIVEFCVNPNHRSPDWPAGYWPAEAAPRRGQWERTLRAFRADLRRMQKLIERVDLFARIPHGSGQTYLREALLLADHNAYHLGQLVLLRRLLGIWSEP
jgi:hypothetical protein